MTGPNTATVYTVTENALVAGVVGGVEVRLQVVGAIGGGVVGGLGDVERLDEPAWLRERMRAEDANAVIGACAEDGSSALCFETMQTFAAAYGAEAGNIALKVLAEGGVYLCGGIAPKSLKTLRNG